MHYRTAVSVIPFALHRHLTRHLSHNNTPKIRQATSNFFPLIGLELHIQLASRSKLFSNSPYVFGGPPNTQLSPHDVAIPGSMPLLDCHSVKLGLLAALTVNAQINMTSRFDRKHYFYADSPAGYQITQHWQPIAERGYVDYLWTWEEDGERLKQPPLLRDSTSVVHSTRGQAYFQSRARITRVQLEHDTGKSIHDAELDRSLLDFNRSGVGLVEVVTEPDFTNASQAIAFVRELASLLVRAGVSECNASTGQLRVDVNVSVGHTPETQGGRVEVKNINSIRSVANAISFEIKRQRTCFESGAVVFSETRSYDPTEQITLPMRDKELLQDYRYLPEPNLPPLKLLSSCPNCNGNSPSSPESIELRAGRMCLGCVRHTFNTQSHTHSRKRLLLDYSLTTDRVNVLIDNPRLLQLFNSTLELINSQLDRTCVVRELSFWICGKLYGMMKRDALDGLPDPNLLAEFIELNLGGKIHGETAEKLLMLLTKDPQLSNGSTCLDLAKLNGWLFVNNSEQMRSTCEQVIADNPKLVKMFALGKRKKAVKRLVHLLLQNRVYEASDFNPFIVEQLITELLDSD